MSGERCERCDDPVCDVPAAHEACKGINWYTESDDADARHERLGRATRDCLQRPAVDWRERALAAELRLLSQPSPRPATLTVGERISELEARVAEEQYCHAEALRACEQAQAATVEAIAQWLERKATGFERLLQDDDDDSVLTYREVARDIRRGQWRIPSSETP